MKYMGRRPCADDNGSTPVIGWGFCTTESHLIDDGYGTDHEEIKFVISVVPNSCDNFR